MRTTWLAYALLISAVTGCAGAVDGDGGKGNPNDSDGGGGSSGGGQGGEHGSAGGHQGGSAGSSAGSGGSMGEGGSPGSVSPKCPLQIGGLSVSSLARVVAGTEATVTVQARLSSGVTTAPKLYSWDVLFGGQTIVTKETTTDELTFPIASPGTYIVKLGAEVDKITCEVQTTVLAVAKGDRATDLWMRVIPPPSSNLVPYEDWLRITPSAQGLSPSVALNPATKVTIAPRRVSQASATGLVEPSFVRITSKNSTFRWESHTMDPNGVVQGYMAQLHPQFSYEVLVVPDQDQLFAPFMLAGPVRAYDLSTTTIKIETGTMVKGQLSSGKGPVVAARVLMRDGETPSTMATSDNAGNFGLLSSAGTFSATIRAPEESNLPDLTLLAANGIVVPKVGTVSDVKIMWKDLPVGDLALQVVTANGSPAIGTEVQVENSELIGDAGTLTIGNGQPRGLTGKVLRRKVTGSDGGATFANLPRASYRVQLTPPKMPGVARSLETVVVDQAAATAVLKLATTVKIKGVLQPASAAAGAVLQAFDSEVGSEPPTVTIVAADGSYTLSVAPFRTYVLRIVPTAASGYPVAPLPTLGVTNTDRSIDIKLPSAKRIDGTVTATGEVVAGSIVQIFCLGDSKDCICTPSSSSGQGNCPDDRNVVTAVPLAEALTDRSGHFSLLAIDPASN